MDVYNDPIEQRRADMAKWCVGDVVMVTTDVVVGDVRKKYVAEIMEVNFSTYTVKDIHTNTVADIAPELIHCRYIG